MVYRIEKARMGITIKISTHRKHGNGAKGGGRKNSSGKKAVVLQSGQDPVTVVASTATSLIREVRERFRISSDVKINREGETHI